MVDYCAKCGKVKIITFCPRCETFIVPNKGFKEVECNKCHLTIKKCTCTNGN